MIMRWEPRFDLLFATAASTLLAFGADPKRLGAQIGFTLVLHTWTREMLFHPHVHAIVTGGGLSPDGERWLSADPDYLFPAGALSLVFRGKFLEALIDLYQSGALADARLDPRSFRTLTRTLSQHDWVVYAKPAFAGPTPIVNYLGRYTHRVALSNSRLLSITDDAITFRTRGQGTCSLPPDEFIRRFLLHVLPNPHLTHGPIMRRSARLRTTVSAPQKLDCPTSLPAPLTTLAYTHRPSALASLPTSTATALRSCPQRRLPILPPQFCKEPRPESRRRCPRGLVQPQLGEALARSARCSTPAAARARPLQAAMS